MLTSLKVGSEILGSKVLATVGVRTHLRRLCALVVEVIAHCRIGHDFSTVVRTSQLELIKGFFV